MKTVPKTILQTIEDSEVGFSKGQKRIAQYILDSYDKAAFLTASKLGSLVGVSESTVVRFAVELGYSGYPAMQKALQELVRSRLTSTQRIRAAGNLYAGQDLLGAVLESDIDRLREVSASVDRAEFTSAVQRLMKARNIYIMGARSSAHVAAYLNFYMHLMMENVILVQSGAAGEIFEQLLRIGKGDVMIVLSFPRYSAVTISTVQFALDRGADVIAITDNRKSPVAVNATEALLAPSEMFSFVDSFVAPMSLINALLVALSMRIGPQVSDTFEELEDIWDKYGVFSKSEDE